LPLRSVGPLLPPAASIGYWPDCAEPKPCQQRQNNDRAHGNKNVADRPRMWVMVVASPGRIAGGSDHDDLMHV
jgi:hypothetical protein